jgi:hypothetical protein
MSFVKINLFLITVFFVGSACFSSATALSWLAGIGFFPFFPVFIGFFPVIVGFFPVFTVICRYLSVRKHTLKQH